ncbi:MAG TPA: hypothetical protein VL241_02240, partial [Gemmatimonadales bacterium]|nr:hypothetical protein [Gemmatimonadales bacterium]
MRVTRLAIVVGLGFPLFARSGAAQDCYAIWLAESGYATSNPHVYVDSTQTQSVRIYWTDARVGGASVTVYPGHPYHGSLCAGKPLFDDLNFDADPRPGVRYRWWIGDPHKPLPQGGPQDPAVRAFLKASLGFPELPRKDKPNPSFPQRPLAYTLLDFAAFTGDTALFGVTVTAFAGRDTVLAAVTYRLVLHRPVVAAPPPPRPADPCAPADLSIARASGPTLQSAGATGASGAPVQVDPALRSFRDQLATMLGCYAETRPLLRAFYRGTLTSGVGDPLAQELLPLVRPREADAARQHAQLLTLHDRLLGSAEAVKVVRELFAEHAPIGTPLARLEAGLAGAQYGNATWSEALRRMDRHLATGAGDAMAEARTEATLYLLSRRGEWTKPRIVQQLAAFAPPLAGAVARLAAPLYEDLPATKSPPAPLDEAAPATVDYALDQAGQLLGLLGLLGVPQVKEVSASLGRIRAGVKLGTLAGTPLDALKQGLDALPPDSSVTAAKGALRDLTRAFGLLSAVAGEPDRLMNNARYEAALAHFAERNASLPSLAGWIAAAGDEIQRTTALMLARRDTIAALRAGVEQRFGRPYERVLEECTPNLDCFQSFADYKSRLE